MTEPLRNYGDHSGATAVYVVVAPRIRCDGGIIVLRSRVCMSGTERKRISVSATGSG